MADCKGIRDTKTGVVYSLADEEARGDISRLEKSVGSMRTQADSYSRTETDTLLKGKLDISAGTENAGKFLAAGEDGTLSFMDPGVDKTLPSKVAANTSAIGTLEAALGGKAGLADVYTKTDADTLLSGKADASSVPASLSQLENDTGFVTSAVENLKNYYLKSETYTKEEVNSIADSLVSVSLKTVDALPGTDISANVIYLVPRAEAEDRNVYDEYIYVSDKWEIIGSTRTDLSDYYTKEQADALLGKKQGALAFDTAPTADSENPVTSGGVKTAVDALGKAVEGKQDRLVFDEAPAENSVNPVTSGGVYTALAAKQDTLTFDEKPADKSANPVTSGGVYTALAAKQDMVSYSVEMTSLGFTDAKTADKAVDLLEFAKAIKAKYPDNTTPFTLRFGWNAAGAGYITDGATAVDLDNAELRVSACVFPDEGGGYFSAVLTTYETKMNAVYLLNIAFGGSTAAPYIKSIKRVDAGAVSSRVDALEANISHMPESSHNVPRYVTDTDQDSAGSTHLGKNITSYVADGSLWKRLNGTDGYKLFEDIYAGDYFQMSRSISCPGEDSQFSTASDDKSWVTIAGIDTLWGSGDWPSGGARDNTTGIHISYHHLVMVPGRGEAGNQYFGRHGMNGSHTTEGGYTGSEMFKSVLGAPVSSGSTEAGATISQQLKAEFGSHLMTTRELLSNSVGNAGGASDNGVWTSCQCVLMSEVEAYGSKVWSSSGFDVGNAAHQMPLFAHSARARNNSSAYWWLKAVVSASSFCYSSGGGSATYYGAGYANLFVRPRFVIAQP